VPGGRAGCQALWDNFSAQAYADLRLAAVRDLAFDAYCMQHPDTYCRSAKSYAAHLTRLCCGLEYAGSPPVYAAIRRRLDGRVTLAKPEVLKDLGRITVADLQAASTPEEQLRLVRIWAETVWAAYASQQELARMWIREALENPAGARKKSDKC
jgi:hypothetical protein